MRKSAGRQPAGLERRETGAVVITQEFSVISPVFGGGVYIDPERTFDKQPDRLTPVRSAAVRGHLRFWWRVAYAGSLGSVTALREREAAVWGLASRPGAVSLSIEQSITVSSMNFTNQMIYACFPLQAPHGAPPGKLHRFKGSATITLRTPSEYEKEVRLAMRAWLAFGGIGGRTRRGFGAVSAPQPEDPKAILSETKQGKTNGVPELGLRLSFAEKGRTWQTAEAALMSTLR